MLAAVACAANAGGWDLVAHSPTVALVRVPCANGEWGAVTVVCRGNRYSLTAAVARPGDARPRHAFSATAPVTVRLAVWVHAAVLAHFRTLQCARATPSHYRWAAPGADLAHAAAHMASAALGCRVIASHLLAAGPTWYFVMSPPGGRVAVGLRAREAGIFCRGRTQRWTHGGVYDTRCDRWLQLPQTSRIVQWLFTSIVSLAAGPTRPPAAAVQGAPP